MAETIKIQLEDFYLPVTDEQVREGKNFVLKRERTAQALAYLIDALLATAAADITQICYRYGIDAQNFQIAMSYNEQMFDEVVEVMDGLEEEILDLVCDYATRCTKDREKKSSLLLWVLALGRGGKALKSTLEDRLRVFLKDIEAMLCAAATAELDAARAVTLIKGNLHTAYQMAGMQQAFAKAASYKAQYIRTRGVKHGNQGSSNSEANNILRFAMTTIQMAWMRYQRELMEEKGAVGYYVLRGSTYPCALCDSKVGFHPIDDKDGYPPFHAHCVCWTVPIYERNINEMTI